MTRKVCSTCKNSKDLGSFSPDKRASDGRQSRCRSCVSEKSREAYGANAENLRERSRDYYQRNKEKVLASNARYRQKNRNAVNANKKSYYEKVKLDPEWQESQRMKRRDNSDAKREYDKRYRAKNAEHLNAVKKKWRADNKELVRSIRRSYKARRRSWSKDGDSTSVIGEWESKARKTCYWCGIQCKTEYHVDHYEPLARGGKHEIANLVIACPTCNLKKNASDPYEFAAQSGRLF